MSATAITAEQLENFYGQLEAVSTLTSANVTLSGLQNLNGATGADGDRVAVLAQTTGTENGIYIMRAAAWERAADADPDGGFTADLGSTCFFVEDGTFAGQLWKVDQKRGAGVVGTHTITASVFFDPASIGMATKVWSEVPTFTTGTFTADIANAPNAGTLRVYRNTGRLLEGAGNDYTLSGTTITFARRLRSNTTLVVDYEYN